MTDSLTDEHGVLNARLARLREKKPLRVVDLFAGCGGMSLGLQRAGYTILGGVEIDTNAVQTYAHNLFRGCDLTTFDLHNTPCDITKISPDVYMRTVLQAEQPDNLVDLIVGGPPCQAFSRIGLAKLRSLKQPHESSEDDRASLYLHYLRYVAFFRPLAVIMENVPDMLSYNGQNVAEEVAQALERLGYRCRYTILNAAFYGVPQLRQRLYLIAILDALRIEPDFPAPLYFIELPSGYGAVRASNVSQNGGHHYTASVEPDKTLPPAFTVQDALADLPFISDQASSGYRDRYTDHLLPYRSDVPLSVYARMMREWPGFEAMDRVHNHVTRYLPRDAPIFAHMKSGDQYPQAHAVALELFKQALEAYRITHNYDLDRETEAYRLLFKQIVPPYSPEKFPNKWWKLVSGKPSRTLTAHISKDTYTHIHYDSNQARVISVREAARLQSFPDGFQFSGAMGPMFKQIGNAIPPLQSYILGLHVRNRLQQILRAEVPLVL